MARFDYHQFLIGSLLTGLLCVLPACGILGGNGDDGDDKKFPEPPERPGSAYVVPSEVAPLARSVARENDDRVRATQALELTS
jgi:hypothetical protein